MRRRLLLLAPLVLVASGCMFPQDWHWPRTAASGSNTVETQLYIKDDVVSYQRPLVQWVAAYYDWRNPELVVHVTDTQPPPGYNVIRMVTGNNGGGSTWISIGGSAHLVASTVTLDDGVGRDDTESHAKRLIFHEFCHAVGGGFTPAGTSSIHEFCNWEWRWDIFKEVARVYHDDPG